MKQSHNKFYKMIEQGNRTQQLIYRTSYRKHKERLADIRHNITNNDFLPHRNHHSAKRQLPKDRMKKEEIQSANFYMKSKIGGIKNRTNPKIDELFSIDQVKKEPKRYFDQQNETKIQFSSEMNNGDHIKFILPSQKNPSASFNVKIKDTQRAENTTAQAKMNSIQKSYKKFTSTSVLKDTERDSKTAKQIDLLYNLPQRNEHRIVVYKKTLVFTSMQSCMLQLSLINQRLLIAAYLMGLENTTLRQLFSLKRTTDILKQCDNNYEQLCSRIQIEKVNDKYQLIKITPKQEQAKEKQQKDEDKTKQRAKIQTQFIKRNYYTLVKAGEQQKEQAKQKLPSYSFDHVQAIVERLTAPKRLFKQRDEKGDKDQINKVESNHERYRFSHEQLIHHTNKTKLNENKQSQNSIKKAKLPISLKQSSKQLEASNKKPAIEKNQTNKPSTQAKKEDPKYQELYEQQFDNPSQVKNSNVHSLQKSKLKNNSQVSTKTKEAKIMKQSNLTSNKNESSVYKPEFENQAQQEYQQSFQNHNEAQSPVNKITNNSSLPADNVEEEYQQEFAD